MADNKRPEKSEGVEIPNIDETEVITLDARHWHIIENIFVDYTGQNFGNYAETETDIEKLRSSAIGLYDRFCAAESVFQDLRQALVIVNMDMEHMNC